MSQSPLEDIVVVDCAEGVAGAYASRLLADLGARVVKVEPLEGDRLRGLGPFASDIPRAEGGGLQLALNAGKESVAVDLDSEAGRERLRVLARGAHILIESSGPRVMGARGLGYDTLAAQQPDLVYASHSPFGLDGPYADRLSSEIVDYAMGGWMYISGAPERPPLMVPGHQGELHAGMQLAAGALVALWHSQQTGVGQLVDVSTFEAMVSAHIFIIQDWPQEGRVTRRAGTTTVACADGEIFVANVMPRLYDLIGEPERRADPAMSEAAEWREEQPRLLGRLASWASSRSKEEINALAQDRRVVSIAPVNTEADVKKSRQLAARGWWVRHEHPVAGRIEIPGAPWRFSRSDTGAHRPAPCLDEHVGITLEPVAGRSAASSAPPRSLPFEGLRVLEVTKAWAGPLVGMHFADLGADVIVVEPPYAQATRSWHYAGGQGGPRAHDRGNGFNHMNRNKRGVSLDLTTAKGRELFLRLVDRADILVENNSPRVFPRLGLSFEALTERNPRLIMCSVSGFGATGPERDGRGLGSTIEALSGTIARTGYGPGDVHATGSYQADPIAGAHSTAAIIAALIERERSGRGQHIDVSLFESGVLFGVEALMDYQLNERVAEPLANRSRRIAPQGAYRSAGDDCWLAVAVETDEQWAALCGAIGSAELAGRFAGVDQRLAAQDEIDTAIEAWSESLDHNEATRRLQSVGVPAGPVLANWEIVSDPQLHLRDYWVDTVDDEVGHQRYEGLPWRFSHTQPPREAHAAPRFGGHNDVVLREIARASDEEIIEARAQRAVRDLPDGKLATPPAARP